MHSIIIFEDDNGVAPLFERFKCKKADTVLKNIYKLFSMYENLYLTSELKEKCTKVCIYYTDYNTNDSNRTYESTFADFINQYNNFKRNKNI